MPDVPQILHTLTTTFIDAVKASPVDLSGVVVTTWGEAVRSPEVRDMVAAEFVVTRSRFVDVLEASRAAGHLAPETDTAAAAQALFGMMPGFMLQRLMLQDVDPDRYSAGLRALMDGAAPRVLSTQTFPPAYHRVALLAAPHRKESASYGPQGPHHPRRSG